MKKLSIAATLVLTSSLAFGFDFSSITKSVMDSVTGEKPVTTSAISKLSDATVTSGLKEALKVGVNYAVKELGATNGYLSNSNVKIPLPENLAKVETLIRKAGGAKMADDLIQSMNDAATQAAPKTAAIFVDAVNKMTVEDAQKILAGSKDAATVYFSQHTTTSLKKLITPIIQETMQKNSVATYYSTINEFYKNNAKSFVDNSSVMSMAKSYGVDSYLPGSSKENLDEYVTTKAIDGLFKMIASKEAQIRTNPVEQTTSILKQVFGK